MPVTYTVSQKTNPSDSTAPKKFYARAKNREELSFHRLGKEVADGGSTVSDTDVMAVLNDLIKVLRRHLSNGEIVRLGEFGSFQISIESEGADTEAKFTPALIKKAKIVFRPGEDMRDMLATLKYEKIK